mmetsp:Transcript_17200/g.48235  ORF Transcript_17200/g.48235 Transcript_17200/m.48235 type:complete len:246 (-) Transcript_17200:114-851(-)
MAQRGRAPLAALMACAWAAARAAAQEPQEVAMVSDEACDGNEAECVVHLRQLRGELRAATVQKHGYDPSYEEPMYPAEEYQDDLGAAPMDGPDYGEEGYGEVPMEEYGEVPAGDYGEVPADEVDLFADSDKNSDGEVQHEELAAFLGRDPQQTLQLLQKQDADASGGLSAEEFAAGLDSWAAGCSTRRVASFCVGAVRRCCCRRGALWGSCGCRGHMVTCGGGFRGGGRFHRGPTGRRLRWHARR